MSNVEQLKKEMLGISPGENKYRYHVDYWGSLSFTQVPWAERDYLRNNVASSRDELIAYSVERVKNYTTQKWEIDVDRTIYRFLTLTKNKIDMLARKCQNAKNPKSTVFYKDIVCIMSDVRMDSPLLEDCLKIIEYYYSVTKTEPIDSKNNEVHRSNIFGLLNIIRKQYGNGSSNNRTTNS